MDCLDNLVKEAYRVRGATYISVGHNVFWSDKAHRGHTNITVDKLIEYIQFLINNIYVKVGNRVFKQTIGISMGTDCAPLLAILFLFFYEYKYVKDKLKVNHKQARLVKHTVRYIDDLLTLNNPSFEQQIPNIYPPQLQLKKTTEAPDKLSYLDICLQIQRGKFRTSVYDKRDAFKFHIVNFPFLDSNIPTKPAYGVYISRLVRIGRICDRYEDFKERHRILATRLLKQGYKYDQLCSYFKRFSSKYKDKFRIEIKQHIKDGIPLPLNTVNRLNRLVTVR